MKMGRKIIALILSLTLVLSVSGFAAAYATTISEEQEKLSEIKDNRKEVKADIEALVSEIEDKEDEIKSTETSIRAKQGEINEATASIQVTEQNIAETKEGLNDRLRVMYKNGSIGFLDVLFGSNSLSEFMTNIELVQRIYQNDQVTITTLKDQQSELEQKRECLKIEQANLEDQKSTAEKQKEELRQDKQELQEQLEELNAEAEKISSVIQELQDAQKVYQGSGQFVWPTTSTYITSPFGGRVHPVTGVYTGHTGIDIGVAYGQPVYAAEAGTVILADWYYGYGYAVIIDHGSGISTLYGHNSSLNVSAGQTVTKGQVIAAVGSTGISTGPHVHFEVRVNGSYVDPMGYL